MKKLLIRKTVLLLPVTCGLVACGNEDLACDTWLNTEKTYIADENTVTKLPDQIVLPVCLFKNKEAVERLRKNSVLELDLQSASQLLNIKDINPDCLLLNAYMDLEQKAKAKERTAKKPFFAESHARMMLQDARMYHTAAKSAKTQLGKLKPYLVRGVVLALPGSFSVHLVNSELWVFSETLGSGNCTPIRRPIIVFLKYKPTKVFVGASMAK